MDIELEKLPNYSLDIDEEKLTILSRKTEIGLFDDEFEDKKTIRFIRVGYDEVPEDSLALIQAPYFKLYRPDENSGYDYFGMTFVNHNGFSYIDIVSRGTDIKLASGDYFILLFEDGTKEKYTFQKAASGDRYLSANIVALTTKDLLSFLTKKIDKVKLVSKRKSIYCVYGLNEKNNDTQYFKYQYTSRETGQQLLKYMTYRFIDFNIKNHYCPTKILKGRPF